MPSEQVVIDTDMKVADLTVGQLFNLLNAVVQRAQDAAQIAVEHEIQKAQAAARAKPAIYKA